MSLQGLSWDQFCSIDIYLSTYYGFCRPHVKSQRYRDAKPWPKDEGDSRSSEGERYRKPGTLSKVVFVFSLMLKGASGDFGLLLYIFSCVTQEISSRRTLENKGEHLYYSKDLFCVLKWGIWPEGGEGKNRKEKEMVRGWLIIAKYLSVHLYSH